MLELQPRRSNKPIDILHTLAMPACCPVSKNPHDGSTIEIEYTTTGSVLDVLYIADYLATFVNGKGEIRSAEDMIEAIADDVLAALNNPAARVIVTADIVLAPDHNGKPQSIAIRAERNHAD